MVENTRNQIVRDTFIPLRLIFTAAHHYRHSRRQTNCTRAAGRNRKCSYRQERCILQGNVLTVRTASFGTAGKTSICCNKTCETKGMDITLQHRPLSHNGNFATPCTPALIFLTQSTHLTAAFLQWKPTHWSIQHDYYSRSITSIWLRGRNEHIESPTCGPSSRDICSMTAHTEATTLEWVNTTPFGVPVVPLV